MNSLRGKLITIFLFGTLVPVAGAIWVASLLLDHSLSYAATDQVDRLASLLETTGREYYKQAREALRQDALSGKIAPRRFPVSREAEPAERFELVGEHGENLRYSRVSRGWLLVYDRPLGKTHMNTLAETIRTARAAVQQAQRRDLRRGVFWTIVLLTALVWLACMSVLVWAANRVSRPIRELTRGLMAVARGDLSVRLDSERTDELGDALHAFNQTSAELAASRESLILLTRMESWQLLARKMAHEVKNSLTPIRLNVDEMVVRAADASKADREYLTQAAQIITDEITVLEKRVRAFSELGSEPPVHTREVDLNASVEERISFLRQARPEVLYESRLAPGPVRAIADPDLLRGVLTNLMENAAQAVGAGGTIRLRTALDEAHACVEVHDSGPGLSPTALHSLFEPAISFKRGGMGLGLSIAKKSAVSCGGDIVHIHGDLGGAAFRVQLPAR